VFDLPPTRRCESLIATHCIPSEKVRKLANVILKGARYWRERVRIVDQGEKGLGLVATEFVGT